MKEKIEALTRKVLFEKTQCFLVKSIFSNRILKVRYGKIKDISKENINEKEYKKLIDDGFYVVMEGELKDGKASMFAFKRINNGN